jgi:hypothetical protein
MHIIFLSKHNILQVEDFEDSILVQTLLKVANALTFHESETNKTHSSFIIVGKKTHKKKLNP